MLTHEDLLAMKLDLPEDYEPWGTRERDRGDCSCGCRFYSRLPGALGGDWGVCLNAKSHRAGLLTFEHQGCQKFEAR